MSLDPVQVQAIVEDVNRHYEIAGVQKPAMPTSGFGGGFGPPGGGWGGGGAPGGKWNNLIKRSDPSRLISYLTLARSWQDTDDRALADHLLDPHLEQVQAASAGLRHSSNNPRRQTILSRHRPFRSDRQTSVNLRRR